MNKNKHDPCPAEIELMKRIIREEHEAEHEARLRKAGTENHKTIRRLSDG